MVPDSTAQDSTTIENVPVDSTVVVSAVPDTTSLFSPGQIVVELFPSVDPPPAAAIARKTPDETGTFVFQNLPDKAQYKFRAFLDLNANQKWDGGQIIPYLGAEPLTWYSDSLQVRARWEQTLSDTLRIKTR